MSFLANLLGLVLTAVVSTVTAWWVYQQPRNRAGTVTIVVRLVHVVMVVFGIAELLSASQQWKLGRIHLWNSRFLVNPVCFLLLAIYYTGRENWLPKTRLRRSRCVRRVR